MRAIPLHLDLVLGALEVPCSRPLDAVVDGAAGARGARLRGARALLVLADECVHNLGIGAVELKLVAPRGATTAEPCSTSGETIM